MSETILQEAQRLVHGDRGAAYGHPLDDYQATGDMWRAMILRRFGIEVPITPDFACLMMVAVKLSREAGKPKRDNRVDGSGYFECADMCLEETERRRVDASITEVKAATSDLALLSARAEPGPVVSVKPETQRIPPPPEADE